MEDHGDGDGDGDAATATGSSAAAIPVSAKSSVNVHHPAGLGPEGINPNDPSVLWNAIINPLSRFAIRLVARSSCVASMCAHHGAVHDAPSLRVFFGARVHHHQPAPSFRDAISKHSVCLRS